MNHSMNCPCAFAAGTPPSGLLHCVLRGKDTNITAASRELVESLHLSFEAMCQQDFIVTVVIVTAHSRLKHGLCNATLSYS